MLSVHKKANADATIAVIEVPWDEAPRFGIMNTSDDMQIVEFEEKPKEPKSNLASMGVYCFSWDVLKKYLTEDENDPESENDFGKNIITAMLNDGLKLMAHRFDGYWKDVGTLNSYWEANMELIDIVPEFNLYEEYWKIYTKSEILPPQYIAPDGVIERSIIGEGSEICGKVYNSVIGCGVTVGKDTVIRDSIIMNNTVIGSHCELNKAIIAENVLVGDNVKMGVGDEADNDIAPHIYNSGIVTVGEKSTIPTNVQIGKNTVIFGETDDTDYQAGTLASGKSLIKAGDEN